MLQIKRSQITTSAIYTSAKQSNTIIHRLNDSLQSLQNYFTKWRIKINPAKTQAIIFPFNNRRKRIPSATLRSEQNVIQLSNSINYLGIIFDSKLTFKEHIVNATNKTNKCFRALYPLLSRKSHLSVANKSLIYTAVIRPILAYGSPIWSSAAPTHIRRPNTLQNKIIKTIFKLPQRTPTRLLHHITNIQPFDHFTRSANTKFIQCCSMSDYELIREIEM